MSYRDEGDAILLRVRALTRELTQARQEIDGLRSRLRGEPQAPVSPSGSEAEIYQELESARALLAGLIGEDEPTTPQPSQPSVRPELDALRRALRTAMVRKLGAIDPRIRERIDGADNVEDLVEWIAAVAAAADRSATLAVFAK